MTRTGRRRSLPPRTNEQPHPWDPNPTPPAVGDSRTTPRQLKIGEGYVVPLGPPLPAAVQLAIVDTMGPAYCRELWCDSPVDRIERCDRHATEAEEQLHAAVGRVARNASLRRSRRLR